jgi:hypothetical protein
LTRRRECSIFNSESAVVMCKGESAGNVSPVVMISAEETDRGF